MPKFQVTAEKTLDDHVASVSCTNLIKLFKRKTERERKDEQFEGLSNPGEKGSVSSEVLYATVSINSTP